MDEELQALEAELAQLRAAVNAPATTTTPTDIRPDAPTGYGGLKQFGADILFGVPKGVAGTIDILSYLPTKALQYAGAPTEPWGTTKLVNALIESNQGLEGPGAAEILGVRPSTSVQKAIEFMTPGPGGKGKLLPQLAKESSLGLLAYGGSELGEYATGGPGGALIGALAAPVLMTKVPQFVGSQVASRLAEPTALLRGDEAAIQKAAVQEILDRAGPEGAARIALAQELQTPLMSPLGVPMTAAEIAQTPSLATYQYAMSKPEMGGQTLLDALAKRKEEQALAFGALGTQPQKGQLSEALRTVAAEQGILKADEAIKAIDFDLASRNPTAIEAPSALVQPLGAELRTEIKIAAEEAKKAGREAFKDPAVYNVVVDVPNIRQDVNRIIRGWKRDPSQRIGDATVLTQIKRLRQLDMPKEDLPEGFVPSVKIGQLHDIQVQLGKVLSSTKQGERTPAQALALNLYKYIESVMENAPGSDALFAAKDKWKNYFDTFVYDKERGVISPLKQALKKTPEKVVPFLAGESASIEALKKAGVGARQIETQKLSEFMNLPTAEKKLAWITKNRPALSGADFWPSIENAEQTLKATLEPGQLTEFAKVSEGQIPSQIFSDLGKARRFMKDVEGTQLEDLTRGKFIETLQTGKGTIADRLASQRDVAKTIFKGDYDRLKTIIDDIEGAASPERLKQLATGKQSITSQSQTTLGAIMNKRSLLRLAQNSKYISGIIGTTAGAAGPGGWLGGILVGGAAQAGAMKLGKKAEAVEQRLNATIAEMLAKPELIKFAEAPPTVKNVESFFKQASRLGYFGARGAQQAGEQAPVSPTATPTEDTEIADLEAELESLRQMLPKQEAKVGKQNISIPTGKQYAPASLVKAVMQVESGGKQEAVSSKGARGLMQLMPATARDLGVDAKDPKQNVEGGSRYLQQQLTEFGDESLALAAYNWGPNNIKRAMAKVRAEGKRPTWANIKAYVKIPKETREYVDKVLSLV
jgi:soluble lytic murein transglycosylase-like protein